MRPRTFFVLLVPILAACTPLAYEMGVPGAQTDFQIERVATRGPYLDVSAAAGGLERRLFTRATTECRAMLERGRTVTLARTDGLGPFRSGESECRVVGIGDLESLRGSRSRGGYGQAASQRRKERIEIVFSDEEYLFARGGFSLGNRFGWAPGTDQVVALLPRIAECSGIEAGGDEDGFVNTQFREVGSPALGILDGDRVCPIRALVAAEPEDFQ